MNEAAVLRDLERARLRSLVEVDLETAEALHAEDYELITPVGHTMSKRVYLGRIASGDLRYRVFEPAGDIAVRGRGEIAVLRYQARIGFADSAPFTCWHTDCYELRDGGWQAFWSQATVIGPEGPAR